MRKCSLFFSFWTKLKKYCVLSCSVMSDSVIPWTVACQAPLFMESFRQEYWSGSPFLPLGNLPDSGTELASFVSPALAGRFFTPAPPGKPQEVLMLK